MWKKLRLLSTPYGQCLIVSHTFKKLQLYCTRARHCECTALKGELQAYKCIYGASKVFYIDMLLESLAK